VTPRFQPMQPLLSTRLREVRWDDTKCVIALRYTQVDPGASDSCFGVGALLGGGRCVDLQLAMVVRLHSNPRWRRAHSNTQMKAQ